MRVRFAWMLCLIGACSRPASGPELTPIHAWKLAEPLGGLDLSSDGQAVVLGSSTGESSLWTAPWKLSVPFDRVEGKLVSASFTRDGYVLLLRAQGLVELRSSSGAAIQELQLPLSAAAERARASEGGQYVAFDGRAYALEGQRVVLEGRGDVVFAGDRFAAAASGPVVNVRELGRSGTREFRAERDVRAVAVSRDGERVAAGTSGGAVVWRGDEVAPACESGGGAVAALRFTHSARSLVIAGDDVLRVLELETCRERVVLKLSAAASRLDVADDLAAVGDAAGRVYVWDLFNERVAARGRVLSGSVTYLRLHAGSRTVLAGEGSEAKVFGIP